MTATDVIKGFQVFIVSSWDAISLLCKDMPDDGHKDVINNWLQANWEILVETNLTGVNEFLQFYGDGADCNGASSRICFPDKAATHKIICMSINNVPIKDVLANEVNDLSGMTFDSFVSYINEYYQTEPPFDHVLLTNEEQTIVVKLCDVNFDIVKI